MDKILLYLLERDDFVSGEEISEAFSISRSAVWKHIESAREKGVKIESIARKGYKICEIPEDRIIPEYIYKLIKDKVSLEIVYLDSVDSTNDYAKRNIARFNKKETLIITDNQTSGRGRFDRKWISTKGKDLTFTFIIHPNVDIGKFYHFTIISALSVFDSIIPLLNENQLGRLKIKWPNDIYYDENKLCGILSEIISEEARINSLIIGIGLNVNSSKNTEGAISLSGIIGEKVERHKILAEIIIQFQEYLSEYWRGEFKYIFNKWKKNLKNLGNFVNFSSGGSVIHGKFLDVNEDGSIVIEDNEGKHCLYAGEFY